MDTTILSDSIPLLQQSPGGITTLFPFVLIILVFYLFFIRPQQRRQKEQKQRSAQLQKGDKVTTIGGVHGVVSDLNESTVVIKTGRDSHIEFGRSAVATVNNPQTEKANTTTTKDPSNNPLKRLFIKKDKNENNERNATVGANE